MPYDRRVELRIQVRANTKPLTRKGLNWLWDRQPFTRGVRRRRQEQQRRDR